MVIATFVGLGCYSHWAEASAANKQAQKHRTQPHKKKFTVLDGVEDRKTYYQPIKQNINEMFYLNQLLCYLEFYLLRRLSSIFSDLPWGAEKRAAMPFQRTKVGQVCYSECQSVDGFKSD